jgi:DNA phosphorothioation-associated putative methyltransferase
MLGKKVGQTRYLSKAQLCALPENARSVVEHAMGALPPQAMGATNVVRIDDDLQEVAFLSYPTLGSAPFPELACSWKVDVPTERLTYRTYSDSLNPPILHRTELLVPEDAPARATFQALTAQCEQLGLFDNPTIIAFRRQWYELIQQKGYQLDGSELRPIGNAVTSSDNSAAIGTAADAESNSILRHLTALSRSTLSAPVQSLIRDGLLRRDRTFFDYGCGRGDDLAALTASGYSGAGWDPYFKPDDVRQQAHIVNLGFVINVIEDLEERIEALQGAYSLAQGVLAVAAMLSSNEPASGRAYKDGIRTSRNTFQKYYTQSELQQFIEGVLDEDAYPVGPGIFYVFRDRAVEQGYLLERTSDRTRVARSRLATVQFVRAPRPVKAPRLRKSETPEALAYLDSLWTRCLELGRPPDLEEMPDASGAREHFGSPRRALTHCLARHDQDALKRAEAGRRDDILVMLALHFFERRRRFTLLERRLQKDIKAYFGSYAMAESKAQDTLFSVKDPAVILEGCQKAAAAGLGWLDADHSLQLHTSLVSRLPPALRIYVGCAAALAGDLQSYDLVKVHIQSGKVTLMSFDDFLGKPLPALQSRIKVRLRDQDLDVFTYTGPYPPTLLYYKSRYINEEFPHYAEQLAFEEALEKLGLFDLSGYGLSQKEFDRILQAARYVVLDFQLHRPQSVPDLDERCGANFRYRDLIECGETWDAIKVDNMPRSPETYTALCDLARYILDPVIDYFGAIKLTYGFASRPLTRHIHSRIEPTLDQHGSYELTPKGHPICSRVGAAADFLVELEDMREVADWIAANSPFDRLYYYGSDRPIHVSYGPEHKREIVDMVLTRTGRPIPRRRSTATSQWVSPSSSDEDGRATRRTK